MGSPGAEYDYDYGNGWCWGAEEYDPDPLYWSYREMTRAVLRHLILHRGISPSDPVVAAYELHLNLTTAHREYTMALERCPSVDRCALQLVCFMGCDLRHRYNCDAVASSIHDVAAQQ